MKTIRERFEEKYYINSNACWIWTGAVAGSRSPRPQMRIDWQLLYSTHVAWELYKGPVEKGKLICHSCDEPLCVNPQHLFLGTQTDNMRDASRKNRLTGKKAINEEIVLEIRKLRNSGMTLQGIATLTKIPIGTVGHIANGTRWGNVK